MKRQGQKRKIQDKLFAAYARLFAAFFIISIIAVMVFVGLDINNSIIDTQKQMVQAINTSLDMYFSELNSFSMELLNSQVFKKSVLYDLPIAAKNGENQADALNTVYLEAYKMFEKGYRVGVATRDGYYIWLGSEIIVSEYQQPVDTYADYAGAGSALLLRQSENAYLKNTPGRTKADTDESLLLLSRSINLNNLFARPQAMLEVGIQTMEFERFCKNLADNANIEHLQLHIISNTGQFLYGGENFSIAPFQFDGEIQPASYRYKGNMVRIVPVFSANAYAAYVIPVMTYYNKLLSFLFFSILLAALLSLVALPMLYRVSRDLSRPLSKMDRQLAALDFSQDIRFEKVESDTEELDNMASAITALSERLQASLSEVVTAKTGEMHSRLLALNAQVQPHFLYNTLASISVLADKGETKTVCRMCSDLSSILRYISQPAEQGVALYEELTFLRSYIAIMQERFPRAVVKIDVPIEMMQIQIPKLVLQLIVENAFKYSNRADTLIIVIGTLTQDGWRVRITDNGQGFTPEQVEQIEARCHHYAEHSHEESLQLDGMGLVNLYLRLHHCYKNALVFQITPSQQGGDILLGGSLEWK